MLILQFLVPFNSEVNSRTYSALRILIDPIGGPHQSLEVGLFLVFLAFAKIRRPEVVMAVDLPTVGIRTRGDLVARRATRSPRGGSEGPEGPPRT